MTENTPDNKPKTSATIKPHDPSLSDISMVFDKFMNREKSAIPKKEEIEDKPIEPVKKPRKEYFLYDTMPDGTRQTKKIIDKSDDNVIQIDIPDRLNVVLSEPPKPERKKTRSVSSVLRDKGKGAPKRHTIDEIKNLAEPIYFPSKKKRKGRPPKTISSYLLFEEAKEFVQSEKIPSRTRYQEWFDRNKPKAVPKYPNRVYKEWISWNDYLGTNNVFGRKQELKKWRPLEEAAHWVHSLKIETYAKWMEYCNEDNPEVPLPEDIPARPDLIYHKWRGWHYWLGNKPEAVIASARDIQKIQIYCVVHDPGTPENVFRFILEPTGQATLKERWEREKFEFVRLFWYDPEKSSEIRKIIEHLSSPYLGDEKQRICHNVWEINYYLEILLERIYKFDIPSI